MASTYGALRACGYSHSIAFRCASSTVKAGRILSAATETSMRNAIQLLSDILSRLPPASEKAIAKAKITKVDEEKRLAFGWASTVVDKAGELVIDKQDEAIDPESMEKAVYDYVMFARVAGEMHERRGVGQLVESLYLTPEKRASMGLPPSKEVAWWVGYKVTDDATWQAIKSGELREFSIGGRAEEVDF